MADGEIETLRPTSRLEVRDIGERWRLGRPVLVDLSALADEDAERLADFMAGLAFAGDGALETVRDGILLLRPPS